MPAMSNFSEGADRKARSSSLVAGSMMRDVVDAAVGAVMLFALLFASSWISFGLDDAASPAEWVEVAK